MSAGDDDRHEHDRSAGGVQQAQLPRRLAGPREYELADALVLRLVGARALLIGAGGDGLLERLQMGVHVVDAGLVAQGRPPRAQRRRARRRPRHPGRA